MLVKLNIITLHDVLVAFEKNVDLKTISSSYTEGEKYYNDFEFEGKIWRGTVDNRKANFRGEFVRFISVKLPNDGFIYTSKYASNKTTHDDLVFDDDVKAFLQHITSKIDKKYLEQTWFSYNYNFNKVELYFKCKAEKLILHIGYDYGSHIGYTQKKTYSYDELKNMLDL